MKSVVRVLIVGAGLLTAGWGAAQLDYLSYDLATGEEKSVAADEVVLSAETYLAGSTMLFVRDATLGDEAVYLGVFEVTQAQAQALGWETAANQPAVAYGMKGTTFGKVIPEAHRARLAFPTKVQWQAYAAEGPQRPCNLYQGRSESVLAQAPLSLADWRTQVATGALVPAVHHGVYDLYGNVAEYVLDGESAYFYGGYAVQSSTFTGVTKETCVKDGQNDIGAFKGARLVYTPQNAASYPVTVTLNGEQVWQAQYTVGERVTVSAPEIPAGYRLSAPEIEPASITALTFEMPAEAVSFAWTSAPFVRISVTGGSADVAEVVLGGSVTLQARVPAYSAFVQWVLPDGGSATENPLQWTVPADAEPGSTLAFSAQVAHYPRLFLYGGEAEVLEGEALGEGYYAAGTKLKLTPQVPAGYAFAGWEGATVVNQRYTLGEMDAEPVTLVATFTEESAEEPVNPAVTKIGEDATGLAAALKFGYVAGESRDFTIGGNTFTYYPTTLSTEDYAYLGLLAKTTTYSSTVPDPTSLLDLSRTSTLPLKRAAIAEDNIYYVGVYETTVAHATYLQKLLEKDYTKGDLGSLLPKRVSTVADAQAVLDDLNAAFGYDATFPSVDQIVDIAKAGSVKDDGYIAGAGYPNAAETYGDKKITNAMVVSRQMENALCKVGSKQVDPYGFYDLWGNANEIYVDGTVRGGYYGNAPAYCNLETIETSSPSIISSGFRPVIRVPQKVSVSLEGVQSVEEVPLTVFAGQVIRLAPQQKRGYSFQGWVATTADGECTLSDADEEGYVPYEVLQPVTLSARWAAVPACFTVSYSAGIVGPSQVYPGAEVPLYAENATGAHFTEVLVEPAEAATWDAEKGTLTFATAGMGEVTVTARYAGAKPGYRLRLK